MATAGGEHNKRQEHPERPAVIPLMPAGSGAQLFRCHIHGFLSLRFPQLTMVTLH